MNIRIALLAVPFLLAGCGGSSSVAPDSVNQAGPHEALSRTGAHHQGIGHDARRDYRQAMYNDCVKESDRASCSVFGRGWFYPWNRLPEVHVSSTSTQEEVWAIRRALGILNRSLPEQYRLGYQTTSRTFSGVDREDQVSRSASSTQISS